MKVTYAVENIMNAAIVQLDAGATVADAIQLMVDRGIGSVVIVEGKQMVGIVTERDILKQACVTSGTRQKRVTDVMSSPRIAIDGSAAIGQAANVMAEKKIRRLLVTVEGAIVGIITERDLMRATLDVFNKLSDAWV